LFFYKKINDYDDTDQQKNKAGYFHLVFY